MKCKFCLREARLVKSHIIPEFMYEYSRLYDKKHRFFEIERAKDAREFEYKQKGLREPLFCKECKDKMSKWEKYAKKTLYGGHNPKYVNQAGRRCEEYVLFTGVDYKKFKLFLLSILWRASVTKLDEFSEISLGPHEERIRKMIFEETPGNKDDYGCIITAVMLDNSTMKGFVIPGGTMRVHGHNCCRFFIGGLLYGFFVSKHNVPNQVRGLFLNRSNELRIVITKVENVPFLTNFIEDFFRKGS